MLDVEKVIKGLECCVLRDPDDSRRCAECPKSEYGRTISNSCINGLMVAALALLKAQEPVKPIMRHVVFEHDTSSGWENKMYCPKCKMELLTRVNYCPKCGQAVKWE